jgi:ectoine hydroxylase-related dioxygenase (phytanoyl-CoA dioxygenase family)
MKAPYILEEFDPCRLEREAKQIALIYKEYGLVLFPKFFRTDDPFQHFLQDLRRLFEIVIRRTSSEALPTDLGELLSCLARVKVEDGRILTDLGTQPNKLNSFNVIKYSPAVSAVLREIYGEQAILATPQAGDTLHFFPPGDNFHRYNLPPHQDFQYLMQSPAQITFYMGLSDFRTEVGGLRIWPGSQKLGLLLSHFNANGAYEVTDHENALRDFTPVNYEWNTGDFGLFDSLLAHSSIPNLSKKASRVVQIFRFSDLSHPDAQKFDFRSTCYERRGVDFRNYYPDHFLSK